MNTPQPHVFIADENYTDDNNITNASELNVPTTTYSYIVKKNINSSDLALMLNEKKRSTDPRWAYYLIQLLAYNFVEFGILLCTSSSMIILKTTDISFFSNFTILPTFYT